MDAKTKIYIRLDGTAPLGWPELRDFMNAFVGALKGMPHGPKPSSFVPLEIKAGSLSALAEVPKEAEPAVTMLQRGPAAAWTAPMRVAAEPLIRLVEGKSAKLTMRVGDHGEAITFRLPPKDADWTFKQFEVLDAEVFRVGGKKGVVELKMQDGRTHKCRFDGDETSARELAGELARHLYEVVRVSGVAERTARDDELVAFTIHAFEPGQARIAPDDFFRAMHELVGDDFSLTPEDIISDRQ